MTMDSLRDWVCSLEGRAWYSLLADWMALFSPLSARALRLDNVVYIDLQDRLAESELSMVYHRHIRSAVVRKVISLLNTAER
jgi:hypothetical protein